MRIMSLFSVLMLASLFGTSFAYGASHLREANMSTAKRCSLPEVDELDRLLIENELNVLRAQRNFKTLNLRAVAPITVPVYFHVITKGMTSDDGNVSDAEVAQQIQVLNDTFVSTQVQFKLISIDRTNNAKWFGVNHMSSVETQLKQALRKGDASALNLYTAAPTDGTLGWATFPWDYLSEPVRDGVVIHRQTLPGGTYEVYNLGMTAVHEVGHWLGLFHTFQGGCFGGDSVDDTAAERGPNFGCPAMVPDTCADQPGKDPINNFMNYSDDVCLTEFSTGQITRIHDSFQTYRK